MTATVRRLRTAAIALGLLVVTLMSLIFWYLMPVRAGAEDAAFTISKVESTSWHPELNEPLFIAVLGSDTRVGPPTGGGGRCDAIHIVAINPQTNAGTILNFPRDSWVAVSGMGKTKINAACTQGAPVMVSTLRNLTGIPIQYYVITEFSHFVKFIDELGPITIPVPYRMRDPSSGADFLPGDRPMLGTQVLAFSRNRKDTPHGDFSRTENQGSVILASLRKYRTETINNPHRILEYMRVGRRHLATDIPIMELIKLAQVAREIDPANLKNVTVNGSTGSVGRASVVFLSPGDTFARVADDALY